LHPINSAAVSHFAFAFHRIASPAQISTRQHSQHMLLMLLMMMYDVDGGDDDDGDDDVK